MTGIPSAGDAEIMPCIHERKDWHAALFPTGLSGMSKIIVGAWRDDRNVLQKDPGGGRSTGYSPVEDADTVIR